MSKFQNTLKSNIVLRSGHIDSLDGIRGFAILLVVLRHSLGDLDIWISSIFEKSWMGVDLFFVLSGFLITGILIDSKHKKKYFWNFYVKRALRILPIYILVLSVFSLLSIFGSTQIFRAFYSYQIYFWTYIQNFVMILESWPRSLNYLDHFWSLAIEEQFYLIWPFCVFYCSKKQISILAVFLIVGSFILRIYTENSNLNYMFTLTRMDSILIGSLVALLIRENIKLLNRISKPTS